MKFRVVVAVLLLAAAVVVGVVYRAPARGATCDVNITSPVRDRNAAVALRSGQSLSVTVAGTASRCPSSTVTVTRSVNGAAETAIGTPSTNSVGAWSQEVTLADGATTTVIARMTLGGRTTESRVTYDVNTAQPLISVASPARDDWGIWYLVASKVDAGCGSGGNLNAERFGRAHYVSDIGCADGGQINPSVTVTGASGGWLSVAWNGVPLVDAGITGSPATLTQTQLGTLTLPDLQSGELTFTATTAGGVSSSLTTYATVRTVTPPALVGPDGGQPELTLIDARHATVRVSYVLPHVPEEIGAAHTEFAWTTESVPCGGTQSSASQSGACYSLADGDAGFFSVNTSTTSPAVCGSVSVPDGGCAYGSQLIWVKLDGGYSRASTPDYPTGVIPEAGDRLGVAAITRSSTCAGSVGAINPVGACVSPVERPPANARNMADGGGSARDWWDAYYQPTGLHRVFNAYPVFHPAVPLYPSNASAVEGYLSTRRELQDCRLYDAEASPQVWRCADGTTAYEGDVRQGSVHVPPLNTYAIIPVIAW